MCVYFSCCPRRSLAFFSLLADSSLAGAAERSIRLIFSYCRQGRGDPHIKDSDTPARLLSAKSRRNLKVRPLFFFFHSFFSCSSDGHFSCDRRRRRRPQVIGNYFVRISLAMVEVCEDYLRNLLEDDEFESSILDGSDISDREFVEVEDAAEAIILIKEALALRKVRHVAMPGEWGGGASRGILAR